MVVADDRFVQLFVLEAGQQSANSSTARCSRRSVATDSVLESGMLEVHTTGRGRTMKKLLAVIAALSIACSASAGDKAEIKEEVLAAVEGFNTAYETNEVAAYSGYYAAGSHQLIP